MKTPDNSEISNELLFSARSKQSVTLLLNPELLPALERYLARERMNLNRYLWILVRKFRFLSTNSPLPESRSLATLYQAKGQLLKPVNFKVEPLIWHSLKLIARAHGISICLAFVWLFMKDMEETERVPTSNLDGTNYDIIWELEQSEKMQVSERKNRRKVIIGVRTPGSFWKELTFDDF